MSLEIWEKYVKATRELALRIEPSTSLEEAISPGCNLFFALAGAMLQRPFSAVTSGELEEAAKCVLRNVFEVYPELFSPYARLFCKPDSKRADFGHIQDSPRTKSRSSQALDDAITELSQKVRDRGQEEVFEVLEALARELHYHIEEKASLYDAATEPTLVKAWALLKLHREYQRQTQMVENWKW